MSMIKKHSTFKDGMPILGNRFSDFFDMDRFVDWNWFDKSAIPAVNINDGILTIQLGKKKAIKQAPVREIKVN